MQRTNTSAGSCEKNVRKPQAEHAETHQENHNALRTLRSNCNKQNGTIRYDTIRCSKTQQGSQHQTINNNLQRPTTSSTLQHPTMKRTSAHRLVAFLFFCILTNMAASFSATPFGQRRQCQMQQQRRRHAIPSALSATATQSFPQLSTLRHRSTARRSMTMYVPAASPSSQTPPMSAQRILSTPGVQSSSNAQTHPVTTRTANKRRINNNNNKTTPSVQLSDSVLASCDTLPAFSTAHGLLSPETVRRLDEMMTDRSEALSLFLDTYRSEGPLSCVQYLSDPAVLPHLTLALREICQ